MFFALSLHQNTPLHLAAEFGHKDIVEYLVGEEANIKKNKDGVSNCTECRVILLFDLAPLWDYFMFVNCCTCTLP